MCNIDPKDVETWNTKSSSHTGGGGTHPGNNNESGSNSGNGSNNPVRPEPLPGYGGLSLDEDSEKE